MIKVKLADVVVQVHIRDEYSWQRVLYCPWVNCKYYNDANTLHCLLREAGKCYRTRDEAEKHLIDDYKKLREM